MKYFEFIVFGIFGAIGALVTEIIFLYIIPSPLPSDLPIESLVGIFYFLTATSIIEEGFKFWALALRKEEIKSFGMLLSKVFFVSLGFFIAETTLNLWKMDFDFSLFPIQNIFEILFLHILTLGLGGALIAIFPKKIIYVPAVIIMAAFHLVFNSMINYELNDLAVAGYLLCLFLINFFLYFFLKKKKIFS